MPLGNKADPIGESVAYPPQLPAKDPNPVGTQRFHNRGNLRTSPPELSIAGSERIVFKLGRKHGCT